MARNTAELDDILGAIVDQLIAEAGFDANSCHVGMPDFEFRPKAADTWATVWIGPSGWDQGQIDGGMATIDQEIVVTVYTAIMTDKVGEDTKAIRDASRGLLALRRRVVQALWLFEPVDGSDNEMLREPLRPTATSNPERLAPDRIASLAIAFSCQFDEVIDAEV